MIKFKAINVIAKLEKIHDWKILYQHVRPSCPPKQFFPFSSPLSQVLEPISLRTIDRMKMTHHSDQSFSFFLKENHLVFWKKILDHNVIGNLMQDELVQSYLHWKINFLSKISKFYLKNDQKLNTFQNKKFFISIKVSFNREYQQMKKFQLPGMRSKVIFSKSGDIKTGKFWKFWNYQYVNNLSGHYVSYALCNRK